MVDEEIRAVVTRLARRHKSGGTVIERAAILAEGDASQPILDWILAHEGQPEALSPAVARGGLYGGRLAEGSASGGPPRRYVLPRGVVS